MKRVTSIFLISIVFFILLQTVSADLNLPEKTPLEKWQNNLTQVQKNILQENIQKYEPRILEEFAKLKYPEENQTETNETFIRIVIYLKDTSQTDDVLSNFSSNELKDIINRQISDRIGVKITEAGFYKLIQDDRVDKVYFARKGYFLNDKTNTTFLLLLFGIILIVILLIILFYWLFLRLNKKVNKINKK